MDVKNLHLDLRVLSGIPESYKCSSSELMSISGINLGNLVFRHAVPGLIEEFPQFHQVDYTQFRQFVETEPVEKIIVSAANWLGVSENDEAHNRVRADLLEMADAHVVCLGLGVQARAGVTDLKLGPETERLARVLAERSTLLGMRDKFSEKILIDLGINNVTVLGCPSNFINLDPALGSKIYRRVISIAKRKSDWKELRWAISEVSGGGNHIGRMLDWTIGWLGEPGVFYVLQGPGLLAFLRGEEIDIPCMYSTQSAFSLAETRRRIRSSSIYFTSVDSWLEFNRTCDFCCGMRIHGTMAAIQAGTPALLVSHDRRTSGLADEMGIPQLSPERFLELTNSGLESILELVANSMTTYDACRADLAKKLSTFLTSNHLSPSRKLLRLINSSNSEGSEVEVA